MVAVFAKCSVIEGKARDFIDLAHNSAEKSRAEQVNVSYDILSEVDKNNGEYFFEKWNDKAELDKHMATEHFKKIIGEVQKIIDGELEIHVYETVQLTREEILQ